MNFIFATFFTGLFFLAVMLVLIKYFSRTSLSIEAGKKASSLSILIEYISFLRPVAALIWQEKKQNKYRAMISLCDLDDVLTYENFKTLQLFLLVVFSMLGALILPIHWLASIFVGGVVGYYYVPVRLASQVEKKKAQIELELPNMIDWLVLSVEAGLDFIQAITRIVEHIDDGPLKGEMQRLVRQLYMGVRRRDALASFAARLNINSISSFVAMLIQADTLGTSIAPVLRASSGRLRRERLIRAERKGVLASQKAMLPVALLIMPTTFIVVFGPILVRLYTGGLSALMGQ